MRLWSLKPEYLDSKGLVALWRESLLAQKVLKGETKGYRNHPQLVRFKAHENPLGAIGTYLRYVYEEAVNRGYTFDQSKIVNQSTIQKIYVTTGQLAYELDHLIHKLKQRDLKRHDAIRSISLPDANPLFILIPGEVETWEVGYERFTVTK